MEFRVTVKLVLIAEEPVNPVQLALMGFRIKVKLGLTVEDHVIMPVQLALMELEIKMKLVLTAEEPVMLVKLKKVKKQHCQEHARRRMLVSRTIIFLLKHRISGT